MALRLNPLSTSKGQKYLCELCGKSATLACQHCKVTYYCCREHQSVDWYGVHEKICQLLGALRTLKSTFSAEDERQRRQLTVRMSQHALIDLCKNESQKLLVQGQYELAIPGALQALRFSIEIYGAGSIELVSSYLLLAESNLGLRRLQVAEEFLLYANWSVLKNPDCSNELKSQLCRNFGKLYACQQRFDAALMQLAQDVYYSSLESGPEHIDTAAGYFYMGDIFMMQGEVEPALAFFDKVVDAWYRFLAALMQATGVITDYVSEAHLAEAAEMLKTILAARTSHLGAIHSSTAETAYALGMLCHAGGRAGEAKFYYERAHEAYIQLVGPEDAACIAISEAIAALVGAGAETVVPLDITLNYPMPGKLEHADPAGIATNPVLDQSDGGDHDNDDATDEQNTEQAQDDYQVVYRHGMNLSADAAAGDIGGASGAMDSGDEGFGEDYEDEEHGSYENQEFTPAMNMQSIQEDMATKLRME